MYYLNWRIQCTKIDHPERQIRTQTFGALGGQTVTTQSAKFAPKPLGHLAAWVLTVAGVLVLATANGARTAAGGGRSLVGGILAGWGLFNTVEGLIDHHLLGLHHVRPGPDELLYDLGFLGWGVVMLVIGAALIRSGRGVAQVPVAQVPGASRSIG